MGVLNMADDKVAIITGSSSGIGLGVAKAFADRGYKVALNARKMTPEVEAILEKMRASGGSVIFAQGDMGKPDDIKSMIGGVIEHWGKIDVLVNNAGIQHVEPIDEFPDDKWDAVLAINLSSAFHTTKAVLPSMKKNGWGRIINMASAHGLVASAYKSAYVAAKHGIVGFTKVTALETAELGITANTICPGYVWTPLVEKQIPEQAEAHGMSEEQVVRDVLLSNQPNKKFATVEEIGDTALFLASDGAASITGTTISVDGGWTAR